MTDLEVEQATRRSWQDINTDLPRVARSSRSRGEQGRVAFPVA